MLALLVTWILVGQSSPGSLAASHAHLETSCSDCHVNGAPPTNTQCLACHGALATKGLHAAAMIRGKDCIGCHRDHRGRGADLQAWGSIPGGLHAFDHAALAKWPLVGRHGVPPCVRCHATKMASGSIRYTGLSSACTSCHPTHAHRSPLFDQRPCEWCHSPTYKTFQGWSFDHAERTKYSLERRHRVPCERCHTPARGTALPPTRCEDCHPRRSNHGKRFDAVAGGCATCHTAVGWERPLLAHTQYTKFPLIGKHSMIGCRACHRGKGPADFERVQMGCKECHAHTKVHADAQHPNGKYTTQQCQNCHLNNPPYPPRPATTIYHGPRSSFPLVKGHRDVPCVDCHTLRTRRGKTDFSELSPECGGVCHQDAHAGALGKECSTCHVSGVWQPLKFEHLRFPLEGEHAALVCAACHADKQFRGTPRECADAACHAGDDAHRGALGSTCDRCHLANGDNRFSHALMSTFKLDGAHLAVTCDGCHPARQFKPRPQECGGCHPDPAKHKGMYGTWCVRCHTTRSWQPR